MWLEVVSEDEGEDMCDGLRSDVTRAQCGNIRMRASIKDFGEADVWALLREVVEGEKDELMWMLESLENIGGKDQLELVVWASCWR